MRTYLNAVTFEPERYEIFIQKGSPYTTPRPFTVAAHIAQTASAFEQSDLDWIAKNCKRHLISMVNFVEPPVRVIEFEEEDDALLFKLYAQ